MSRPRQPAAVKGRTPPPARSAAPPRGGAGGRGASAAQRGRTVTVPQVQSDVYTALLGISLTCLIVSCGLLAFVWSGYDFSLKP